MRETQEFVSDVRQACPEESGRLLRQDQDERPLYRRAQHERIVMALALFRSPEPVLSKVEGYPGVRHDCNY